MFCRNRIAEFTWLSLEIRVYSIWAIIRDLLRALIPALSYVSYVRVSQGGEISTHGNVSRKLFVHYNQSRVSTSHSAAEGNVCPHDLRHLEIRFTSPSTVPQLNSISIVSKKERGLHLSLSLYEKFLSFPGVYLTFLFSAPPTSLRLSTNLLKISSHWRVMRDGGLAREKSSQRDLNRLQFYDPSYDLAKTRTKWKSTFNFLLITSVNFPSAGTNSCVCHSLNNFFIDNLIC